MIEWRFAGGKAENLPPLAAELVALRVDVIVAASFQSIAAMAAATKTIPIVFPANADPVGSGFVASMSRPGGNITGLSTLAGDLGAKQIELLKTALPRLSRLAVLLNPANGCNAFVVKSFEAGARKAGVTLLPFEASTPAGIERAFAAMAAARVDAVTLAIDGFFLQEGGRIAALALRDKLAFISPAQADGSAGALMSYGSKLSDNYRRAALYVDKILKGAKPGELPVEQPTAVELLINLKTARALGLVIPQSLLLRADEVIQ